MARIIGTAGIRLTAEGRGLAAEMRGILVASLREAAVGVQSDLTRPVRDDADRTSSHVRGVLRNLQGVVGTLAGGFTRAMAAGLRLTLVGAAAGIALAGVTSLATGVISLVGALGQAAGVAGLLPAAFVAMQAVTATVRIGLTGISEAFKVVGEDAAAFEEAIKDLAPAAQEFMREVRSLQPALDGLRMNVQQRLFQGFAGALGDLSERYLPIANSLFGDIAGSINAAGLQLADFLKEGEVVGQVSNMAGNLRETFRELAPALTPAVSGMLDFTEVGSRFLPQIATEVQGLAVRFQEFMREAAGSGQLEAFFERSIQAAKDLFAAIRDFGAGFAGIFQAAEAAGGGFLVNLRSTAAAFREFTTSAEGQEALIGFFTAMRQITAALLPVLASAASVIGTTLAPILGNLAATVGPSLLSVVEGIGSAFRAAAPGIATLAEGVAAFLEGAAPLLPVLGQIAGIIAGALGSAFKALAPVMTEVAEVLSGALADILPELQPIIVQVAEAVAEVVRAAIPLIPVFLQLIQAVLPLLPPLLQLVAAILPPLISLVTAIMPLIQALAQVFAAIIPVITAVVSTILGILIPPLQLIITVVSQVASIVASAFAAILNVVSTVLSAVGSLISSVWSGIFNTVSSIVTSIGNFIRSGFESARSAIANAMSAIGNAVSQGVSNVLTFFRELPGKILGALADIGTWLFQAGVDLVMGFIEGIKDMISDAINAVGDLVSGVIDTVTSGFGIFSPSRVMRDLAHQTGEGFVLGLEDMIPAAVAATEDMAASVMDAAGGITLDPSMALPTPLGGSSGGDGASLPPGGVLLQQTNIMRPGADVAQFATEVYRNGAASLASASSTIGVAPQGVQRGLPGDDFVSGVSL